MCEVFLKFDLWLSMVSFKTGSVLVSSLEKGFVLCETALVVGGSQDMVDASLEMWQLQYLRGRKMFEGNVFLLSGQRILGWRECSWDLERPTSQQLNMEK